MSPKGLIFCVVTPAHSQPRNARIFVRDQATASYPQLSREAPSELRSFFHALPSENNGDGYWVDLNRHALSESASKSGRSRPPAPNLIMQASDARR